MTTCGGGREEHVQKGIVKIEIFILGCVVVWSSQFRQRQMASSFGVQ